jgi:hypothetical protein
MLGKPTADAAVFQSRLVQKRYDFYGADTEGSPTRYVSHSGTAQAGSGNSVTLAATASATDDAYVNYQFVTTGGTGSGQDRAYITDYNGTTKVATLSSALDTALDTTTTYKLVNRSY